MTSNDGHIYQEDFKNIGKIICGKLGSCCRNTPAILRSKFPIIDWLPKYKRKYLLEDFIAGFTVGLTTIPQAIAYGVVAGLGPQYGLYTAFMGCFTYIIFGSCKDVTIATTAIMAIMVKPYAIQSPDFAVLISFLAGCIILILGLLNLGVLVRFISMPVIMGFTTAAAATIGSSQIHNLFGVSKGASSQFIVVWLHFFSHIGKLSWPDAVLGVGTLGFLLLMKQIKLLSFGSKPFWKHFSLSRNALAVIFGTFLAYILSRNGEQPFRVTGNITAGLPSLKWPPFHTEVNGEPVTFTQMLSTYGATLGFLPLVAILEIVAIAKAFAKGKPVDASQEMIALGMCNIMGSFVQSMPVTGSFTRTAVNNASGVRTTLGGVVTGILVLLALAFLTQTFYYIPKTTLSAIVIAAMISLVETRKVIGIWKTKKLDFLPFLVTLLVGLFWNLEYGILCGILVNLMFVIFASARPDVEITYQQINNFECGLIEVKQRLDYSAAEYLSERILKLVDKKRSAGEAGAFELIIINGFQINTVDYTVAMTIVQLREDLKLLNCDLLFWQWHPKTAGVLYRANSQLSDQFYNETTLEEVIQRYGKSNSLHSSKLTILAD